MALGELLALAHAETDREGLLLPLAAPDTVAGAVVAPGVKVGALEAVPELHGEALTHCEILCVALGELLALAHAETEKEELLLPLAAPDTVAGAVVAPAVSVAMALAERLSDVSPELEPQVVAVAEVAGLAVPLSVAACVVAAGEPEGESVPQAVALGVPPTRGEGVRACVVAWGVGVAPGLSLA